ncbi:hypothetical protein VSU19_14360 [Verrucomicrobiales bacterium BCK34]|nr:hypothetical protein [Verrucomicrobiales bacterium BCK34]
MSKHREAILFFGVIIPGILLGIVLGGTLYARSKITREYQVKTEALEKYIQAKTVANEFEAKLSLNNRREKMAYWNSKLEEDFIQSMSQNLNKILAKYDSEMLQQTQMGQAGGGGSIAGMVKSPLSRIEMTFKGSFKPMQLLLAEIEDEMPHLILESLSISPNLAEEDSNGSLIFNVTYAHWEKPEA